VCISEGRISKGTTSRWCCAALTSNTQIWILFIHHAPNPMFTEKKIWTYLLLFSYRTSMIPSTFQNTEDQDTTILQLFCAGVKHVLSFFLWKKKLNYKCLEAKCSENYLDLRRWSEQFMLYIKWGIWWLLASYIKYYWWHHKSTESAADNIACCF
jgi:hypothetical protein